ncbi:MAG: thioredoxin family protein [Gammaproteobacteria bacterium]|nr:thioredoxin family protein [Gammaproteobacteria bacterium]MCW8840358.1 thioredoxin family protein [Gammaproteobacteria bacterium]MCW8928500.1 thioredoxin family protein [Gammaproteobacteria bacterium]MCW8957530.1 thioredoxin family protein [Gammaproteobacteria bacterium]MCW8972771.1 thioredoxin family protein [Gammaproteobacteria bacterium]
MTEIVDTAEQLEGFIADHPAAVFYFSGNDCNVCQSLFPKVETLLQQEFPRVGLGKINCSEQPEMAAQHGVFTVPSLILYFEGRETQRFARNISLGQLREALARPYQLLFE